MTRKTTIITGVIALLAVAAIPFLYAGTHGMPGTHGFGLFGRMHKLRSQLDLTDDQVTQLKAIAKDLRAQNAPYRDQLRGEIQNVANALIANPNDVSSAQALLDQQSQAERALKTNVLNAASKALKVLTPDQRVKLTAVLAKHQARMAAKHLAGLD